MEKIEDHSQLPLARKSVLDGLSIRQSIWVFKKTSLFCAIAAFSAMWSVKESHAEEKVTDLLPHSDGYQVFASGCFRQPPRSLAMDS